MNMNSSDPIAATRILARYGVASRFDSLPVRWYTKPGAPS